MLSAEGGRWLVYDGRAWVEATPSGAPPQLPEAHGREATHHRFGLVAGCAEGKKNPSASLTEG
jgi:hypothetical protein